MACRSAGAGSVPGGQGALPQAGRPPAASRGRTLVVHIWTLPRACCAHTVVATSDTAWCNATECTVLLAGTQGLNMESTKCWTLHTCGPAPTVMSPRVNILAGGPEAGAAAGGAGRAAGTLRGVRPGVLHGGGGPRAAPPRRPPGCRHRGVPGDKWPKGVEACVCCMLRAKF